MSSAQTHIATWDLVVPDAVCVPAEEISLLSYTKPIEPDEEDADGDFDADARRHIDPEDTELGGQYRCQ